MAEAAPKQTSPHRGRSSAIRRFFEFGWLLFPFVLIVAAHFVPPLNEPIFSQGWQLNLPTADVSSESVPAEGATPAPAESAAPEGAPAEGATTESAPAEGAMTESAPAEGVTPAPAEGAMTEDVPAEVVPADGVMAEDVPAEGAPAEGLSAESAARLPWFLLAETIIAIVWVVGDFYWVADMRTRVRPLRMNAFASTTVALGVTGLSTWQLAGADHALPWGYLAPWVASVLDAWITADRAINNAAQKPFMQQFGGGER